METIKRSKITQRHNARKAPQPFKVAETSSLAPGKKKVRFAPMVDERAIPEAEQSGSSTNSSSSSNTSDDSYTRQDNGKAVRSMRHHQPVEQRRPGTDKIIRTTKRNDSIPINLKSMQKNEAHVKIEDRKIGRAKSTSTGSTPLSNSRGAVRKLKPVHPTLDAIIIPRSGLASYKEKITGPRINGDTYESRKDRSSKRSSPFQKSSVAMMPRHKIMKGSQIRSAYKSPPPGLQYDARTGRLFRDV